MIFEEWENILITKIEYDFDIIQLCCSSFIEKLLSTNHKNRKLPGKLLCIKQLKICAVGVILSTAIQEINKLTRGNGTKTEELEAKANTKYLINVVLVFLYEGFRFTC